MKNFPEKDKNFLGIISEDELNSKTAQWGALDSIIYLDQAYQRARSQGNVQDMNGLMYLYNKLNSTIGLKGSLGNPVPGILSFSDLGNILKNASTWGKSTNTDLLAYLNQQLATANSAGNTDMVNELTILIALAKAFKTNQTVFGSLTNAASQAGITIPGVTNKPGSPAGAVPPPPAAKKSLLVPILVVVGVLGALIGGIVWYKKHKK